MSASETLGGGRPNKALVNFNHSGLSQTFLNGEATEKLVEGQEVYLKTDGSVAKCDGTQFPIGVVYVGGKAGESVTVKTRFIALVVGKSATAGNAARMQKPNGTVSDDLSEYVVAVQGNYASAMQLSVTSAVNESVKFGILYQPITVA